MRLPPLPRAIVGILYASFWFAACASDQASAPAPEGGQPWQAASTGAPSGTTSAAQDTGTLATTGDAPMPTTSGTTAPADVTTGMPDIPAGQSTGDSSGVTPATDPGEVATNLDAGGDAKTDGGAAEPGAAGAASSTALFETLSLGINLGNSLDVPEGETAWGNPPLTQQLVQAMADAGFQLARIPVTWSMHTGPGPDYTIDAAWLGRVEEVVGYALTSGMLAVINVHHDGADGYDGVEWLSLNDASGAISDENDRRVRERFEKIWQQIAAHFSDFDERLLFESMNEIHDGYDAPDGRYYATINALNQMFVDTVRASGGNNLQRHLVVPGYNTNIDYTLAGFTLPSDPTPNHLILSVHFYDPWPYAGAAETHVWGAMSPGNDGWGQEDHVVEQFDRLAATYTSQGVPVLIGEYGAVHQAGYEDYRRYYMEYVTLAAAQRGMLPVYWDNGSPGSGAESFGLFDRNTGRTLHPTVLQAMVRATTGSPSLEDVQRPQ